MADQYYDSDLTGKQLDAAFAKMANIDTYANQAASSASEASGYAETATSAASQAQTYASQANTAKNNAQTYAGQASDSADSAQTYAGQASGSASAAAASAASIEGDVEAAANSASQAATSASQAAESASDAADAAQTADDAKSTVQQSASAAQTAATQAAQSAQDAQSAATQASGSASTAQSAATLIEDNLEAIQAAPGAAQAAQQAASDAQAAQTAAEDAAERAEQIADFNPSDFATAAQGSLAETAVQPDALDAYALKTEVPDTPADIGAATAAQGAKADTAVQSVNGKTGTALTLEPGDVGAATAAQGQKADTAVQTVNGNPPDSAGNVQLDLTTGTVRSVNGKDPDGSGNVQLSAGDVGAATAAQGALAATAVQPADLDDYAKAVDIPKKLPNPQALTIRLGSGSPTTYDGSAARSVTVTPAAVGAAQEPLTGNLDDVTPAQVRASIQAGRQVSLLKDDNILSAWVDTGTNVQCLYGWNVGTYANRPRAVSTDAYSGDPTGSNTWSYEKLYGNVLPDVTSADNGKTVVVQNGQWNLGTAGGGGVQIALLYTNPNPTSNLSGSYISVPGMSSYDLLGIVPIANTSYGLGTDCSGMQIFRNTQSAVTLSSVSYRGAGPEVQARELVLYPSSNRISVGDSSKFNNTASFEDTRVCVPYLIFGIKF